MINSLNDVFKNHRNLVITIGGVVVAAIGVGLFLRFREKKEPKEEKVAIAEQAFGFGNVVTSYDKGRLRYPDHVVEFMLEKLNLPAEGGVIADLGAGSGKFTQLILQFTGNTKVIASEPVESFGGVMRAKFQDEIEEGRFDVVHARTEHLPFEDSSLDAVTCAAAFHWFANEEALAEISRVLKPGGVLGLIWQHREKDTDIEWLNEFHNYMKKFKHDHGSSQEHTWKHIFTDDCPFQDLDGKEWRNSSMQTGSITMLMDRAISSSRVASRSEEEREMIAEEVKQLVLGVVPEARDNPEYVFEIPHWCEVYWATNKK